MNVPEKYKPLAHAWVDGAQIQINYFGWKDIPFPTWDEEIEYRVKPPRKKYRVYKWHTPACEVATATVDNERQAKGVQEIDNFIDWLGPWIEYE